MIISGMKISMDIKYIIAIMTSYTYIYIYSYTNICIYIYMLFNIC